MRYIIRIHCNESNRCRGWI